MVGGALHYCLLLDTSNSERERFKREQDEAKELLSKVVQAGRDDGTLVAFSDQVYLDAEGRDPLELMNAIAKETPGGPTALYNAVVSSADHMSRSASGPGLRVMFILSDGDDNFSRLNLNAAVLALLKAGIRVYVIGGTPDDARLNGGRAGDALKQFAESTGGRVFFPVDQEDVGKAVTDITDELANIFTVTYTLPGQNPDGQLHKLQVKCRKKDVSITAPDRSYAPRP